MVGACSRAPTPAAPTAIKRPVPSEVVREIYGVRQPDSAKGQELYLYRVVIPPGEQIPAHTHPGLQFGHIMEGEPTYQVVEGTVEVVRQAGTDQERREQVSGATVTLEPGDTVIEHSGMVHIASNDGDVPIVVMLSSLIPKGDELSSPVSEPGG